MRNYQSLASESDANEFIRLLNEKLNEDYVATLDGQWIIIKPKNSTNIEVCIAYTPYSPMSFPNYLFDVV